MISAFGVEHGDEVAKSLKPPHKAALMAQAMNKDPLSWRKTMYATDRLSLHNQKDLPGDYKGPLPLASKYRKKGMARLTRVNRNVRDQNRAAAFKEKETS